MIFEDYLSGMGINAIVRKLRRLEIPTKHGGIWRENVVANMLGNEKHKGDMLLQKTFRSDHITKKKVKNTFVRKVEGKFFCYIFVHNAFPAYLAGAVRCFFGVSRRKAKTKKALDTRGFRA